MNRVTKYFLLVTFLLSGCAKPYIVPGGVKTQAPALHTDYILMPDGFRLPLHTWKPETTPKAIVIALHGMNDYGMAFESTGNHLAQQSILVYAYDQRGFGATSQAGLWHGSRQMVEDAITVITLVRKRYTKLPIYLLGESMGGAVSLIAQNSQLDGTILVAPAVWSRNTMPWYQRLALWFAVHTMPDRKLTGKGLDIRPTDNIKMLRAWSRDPLVIKATRVDALYGVTNLMDSAAEIAINDKIDTLLLYGMQDDIIPDKPICQLAQRVSSNSIATFDTVHYSNGHHMLTRDLQAANVLDDITNWIHHRKIERNQTNPALDCNQPQTRQITVQANK